MAGPPLVLHTDGKALRQTADRGSEQLRHSTGSVTVVKHNRKWKLIKGFGRFQASVLLLI